MKKKLLCVLLGISMIGMMPGFTANAEESATEAESSDFLCGRGWQRGIQNFKRIRNIFLIGMRRGTYGKF